MSNLSPRLMFGNLDLTDYPYSLEFGMDLGSGENVYTEIRSLIQDGSLLSSESTGNRTITFAVLIEGADMLSLAEAEKALILEADKQRNTLSLDPGDGVGPTTVYDTFRAQVVPVRSDVMEMANMRRYELTVVAMPWGRSTTEVVTEGAAFSTTPTVEAISDGSSATNWANPYGPTITSTSGYLTQTVPVYYYGGPQMWQLYDMRADFNWSPPSPFSTAGTQYLQFDYYHEAPAGMGSYSAYLSVYFGGSTWGSLVSREAIPGSPGWERVTVNPGPSLTQITTLQITLHARAEGNIGYGNGPTTAEVRLDNVQMVSASPPLDATGKQTAQEIAVAGSVRTSGALEVSSANALGHVVVYTHPSWDDAPGYAPPLRRWLSAGTVGGSAGPFNVTTSGAMTYSIPVAHVPSGAYLVVGLVSFSGGGSPVTLAVDASLKFGTSQVGPTVSVSATDAHVASGFAFLCAGGLMLPTTSIPEPASSGAVVEIVANAGGAQIDEVWLFRMSDGGSLTVASGVPQRLRVTAATTDRPYPGLWIGASASTMRHVADEASSWGEIGLRPPSSKVFIATSGTATRDVTFQHFPRWHSNAAE